MKRLCTYLIALQLVICFQWHPVHSSGGSDLLTVALKAAGKTSGTIAHLIISNNSPEEINTFYGPFVVFAGEEYSPVYIDGFPLRITAGRTRIYPVNGISILNHLPVLPEGKRFDKNLRFFRVDNAMMGRASDTLSVEAVRGRMSSVETAIAYPGTGIACAVVLDNGHDMQMLANLVLDAVLWSKKAYADEEKSGIGTALAADPDVQRDFLMQLMTWIYAGALVDNPYSLSKLKEDLLIKFRKDLGGMSGREEQRFRVQIEQEADRFYETALRIGRKAGIFAQPQRGQDPRMPVANSTASWYMLPGRPFPVYLEDRSMSDMLGGQDAGESVETLFHSGPDLTFSMLRHKITSSGSVRITGAFDPFDFQGNLVWKTRNSPEKTYELDVSRENRAFEIDLPVHEGGRANVEMLARDGAEEFVLFASAFRLEQEIMTLQKGDRFVLADKEYEVALVGDRAIYLKEGNLTHRLSPEVSIDVAHHSIVLQNIANDRQSANVKLLSKVCCDETGGTAFRDTDDKYSALLRKPASLMSRGFKGMVLPGEIGFSPREVVIGVNAHFETTPESLCCGWLSPGNTEKRWGPYLADRIGEAMRSAIDSAAPETGPYRVVLMDPATRHHLAAIVQERSGDELVEKLPSAKLLNPDLIIDGHISIGCCDHSGRKKCAPSSLKITIDASLVNADNGLILSSYNSDETVNGLAHSLDCYDPFFAPAREQRRKIADEFAAKVTQRFLERLTWKVQW